MNVQPLDVILTALSKSESMVPDPVDRAAVARTADVLRGLPHPPRIVLVVGDDTDPIVGEVQWQTERLDTLAEGLRELQDGYDELLAEMRVRRQRLTRERDEARARLAALEPEMFPQPCGTRREEHGDG